MRRRRLMCRVAALCLLMPLAARAQQRPAPAYEEGLFDLSLAGAPARTIPVLVTPDGRYLLPLGAVLEQLGIPLRVARDSGLARAGRGAGAGVATVRWIAPRAIQIDGTVVPIDSADVVLQPAEVFLAAPRMAALVEGTLDVDLATLTVHASRPGGFPVQVRQDVVARREVQLARNAELARAQTLVDAPFVPRTGFGVVEWSLSGSGSGLGATPSAAETRVGLDVWGGMLKSKTTLGLGFSGTGAGVSAQELSYQRVFPFNDLVRQVQLGDVVSEGPLARGMRGLTLTNAPFVRDLSFDEMPFSRPLPPGWEYEVYEGTRLLGYADAATNTPLRIPLQYGATPLRVRLYGPAGEVVESAVSYVIPVEQLRAGAWQYSAGGGRCVYDACSGLAYGELRHGLSRWLTVQGGLDGVRDSARNNVRPYGALSFIPAPGWTALLQAQSAAYLRTSVQMQGEGRVMGGFAAGVNAPGEGGTAITADPESAWYLQSNLQLRNVVPWIGDHTMSLAARADGGAQSGLNRWDVTSVAPIGRVLMELAVQSDPRHVMGDTLPGNGPMLRIAPTVSFSRGIWARLGSPVFRVEGGFQQARLAQWDIGASLQPGRSFVSIAVRRLIGVPRPEFSLGGTIPLGAMRLLTHHATRGGVLEGGYTASGAVAVGSVRKVNQLEYGGLGLAGVEGVVYRDRDGDGQFGPGDQPVADAVIQAGGLRTRTDAKGRYALWNVTPYEPLMLVLDTLSLEEPSWTSLHAQRPIRLSPQQYTRVDFPLNHTRELVGRLSGPQVAETPAGVTVTLRDSASKVSYETRTFSDGGFYLSQVRPGRYELTVSESSLRALKAAPVVPVTVVVKGDADEVIELPAVVLTKDPKQP